VDFVAATIDALRVSGRIVCRIEARDPWGVESPSSETATFHAVRRGECLLRLPDKKRAVQLSAGDVIVLPRGTQHVLCDSARTKTTPLAEVVRANDLTRSWTMHVGGADGGAHGGVSVLCGSFHFDRRDSSALLSLLPPFLRVPNDAPHANVVHATLTLLEHECESRRAGSELAVARLVDTLLVHLLRHWVAEQPEGEGGWLAALRDERIGRALRAMHGAPLRDWVLAELAAKAGMSRTSFAIRFAELVGEPPMRYLARLRLGGAAQRLRQSDASIIEVARAAGYDSEAALSKAFKRQYGLAPGKYRRMHESAP
jgi:AraC-like DNA-binding protein